LIAIQIRAEKENNMPSIDTLEKKAYASLAEREVLYEKLLQKQLQDSLTSIYGEMTKIYNKFAIDGKLTRAEMTRYNKYTTMEANILKQLDPAIKANIKTIKKLLPEMYNESFFHYAWAMDQASGVALTYGAVNTKVLLAAFDITNSKNIELKEALANYGPTAKKKLRGVLLNGISLGRSYKDMTKELEKAINVIHNNFMRIVRTEAARAIAKGQDDAYQQAIDQGVEGERVWDATLDGRTRPDHANADGQKRDKNGFYHIGGELARYPLDLNLSAGQTVNCRCHERIEIEGYSPQLRRARDEGVLPYMDYKTYAKEYHPEWLERKGYENLGAN
jgi:hypothetical protein